MYRSDAILARADCKWQPPEVPDAGPSIAPLTAAVPSPVVSLRARLARPSRPAESPIYRDTRSQIKQATRDELAWRMEGLADELATAESRWADVPDVDIRRSTVRYDTFAITERMRAIDDELSLREHSEPAICGTAPPPSHDQWIDLARLVSDRANVVQLLDGFGYPMTRSGKDPRRDGSEWSGPLCPQCGMGTDRLRAFDGPNGRAWCRRCGWSADAIALVQTVRGGSFREAVAALAEDLAIRGRGAA